MGEIGIVIQGAIVSGDYDCTKNIHRLIEEYSKSPYCGKIIVSTWEGETFSYERENANVVIIKTQPILREDFKNRLKQFRSTYEGVKFLKNNSDAKYILKLRTDMYVSSEILEFIIEFYKEQSCNNEIFSKPILSSYSNRTIPFFFGDYFFAGQIADIESFLRNNLDFGSDNFQGAVEVDCVLKHLFGSNRRLPLPKYIIYKQMCIARMFSREHLVWKTWLSLYSKYFGLFPKKFLMESYWRGKPWCNAADDRLYNGRADIVLNQFYDFYDEWKLLRTDINKYLELPLDIQHGEVRYIWDWWQYIKKRGQLFAKEVLYNNIVPLAKIINRFLEVLWQPKQFLLTRLRGNIYCRHLAKKILGRQDYDWDFRKFEQQINFKTWKQHDGILKWAEQMALNKVENECVDLFELSNDAIVKQGYLLKQEVLKKFKQKYKEYSNIKVLIHFPKANDSPAGNSLFKNMIDGLKFLGIQAKALNFDETIEEALEAFEPTIFLTSDHYNYLSRINWQKIKEYRKTRELYVGLTAAFGIVSGKTLEERLLWAKEQEISFYYCFDDLKYCVDEYSVFLNKGHKVISVPFGFNPLTYYPVPNIERTLEYSFLASINRDKWNRYIDFLPDILKRYVGFLSGPGWTKINVNDINADRDRYIYAKTKVGLNLHLDYQINAVNQLNERTYMLAACGVPQLIDNPAILSKHFSEGCFFVANNPKDYALLFEQILNDPQEAQMRALKAQREVFANHTTFHRMDSFVRELLKLLQNG